MAIPCPRICEHVVHSPIPNLRAGRENGAYARVRGFANRYLLQWDCVSCSGIYARLERFFKLIDITNKFIGPPYCCIWPESPSDCFLAIRSFQE